MSQKGLDLKKEEEEEEEISRNDFRTKSYLGHLTVIVTHLWRVKAHDSNNIHHSAQCLMDTLT